METQDMATEELSNSAKYLDETSESEGDRSQWSGNCRVDGVTSVNNERANIRGAGPEHMENLRAGVIEDCTTTDKDVDGVVYEDYDVAETVTSSDNNNTVNIGLYSNEMDQDNSNFSNLQHTGYQEEVAETDYFQTDSDDAKGNEKFNVETLSYELQVGYRILSNMMSASNRCVNKLFLYPVDDNYPETSNYYEKIKEPIWMFKMKEKFENLEYKDLTDFMSDFRLMIENCYRFNGPDNFVSKKAQKLETMMKQKVALLSRDLRDKILGSVSSNSEDELLTTAGLRRRIKNPNVSSDDPSQQLLSQLRRDREMQEKVDRRQKVEDRKALEQAKQQELQDWEDNMLGPDVKKQIKTMWELPQIGLFVYLCMESLGLEEEITQYQLERGIAMPRECSDFRRLMTCLLSTPHQRKSLKSFMPYQVWNSKLSMKIDFFYKTLAEKKGNHIQACYKLGLDSRGFKMMGKSNPLLKKQFHELSYLKRVWILKNYCDFCMETQQYLQKTIDDIEAVRPLDVREVLLGSDVRGYRYINFPMFTGKDIRIYKHSKTPEPSLESLSMADWSVDIEKPSASSSRCSTPVNPRKSRLTETPSTSLRARALLQAAESKEASPLRDTSRSGSEVPESKNSVSQTPLSDTSDHTPSSGKTGSAKKRKRASLFTGKRKRLKPRSKKTTPSGKQSVDSCNVIEEEGDENDLDSSDVQNDAHSILEDADSNKSDTVNLTNCIKDGDYLLVGKKASPLALSNSESTVLENKNNPDLNSFSSGGLQIGNKDYNPLNGTNLESIQQLPSTHQDSAYLSYESDKSLKDDEGVVGSGEVSNSVIQNGVSKVSSVVKTEITEDVKRLKIKDNDEASTKQEMFDNIERTVLTEIQTGSEMQLKTELNYQDGVKKEISKSPMNKDNGIKHKNVVNNHSDGQDVKEKVELDTVIESVKKECDKDKLVTDEKPVNIKNEEVKKEEAEDEEDSDEDEIPDVGHIELIAESMEDIRQLMNKLSNPEPIKRGKRTYPGVMKPCEEELLANLTRFHDELLKYEKNLANARVSMQSKLRKEVDSYVEPKVEESRGWDSDHSQSSKDSSDEEEVSKPEPDTTRQSKRIKIKQVTATTALLSSAASKLSSITGEGNEDSNDSFELDISSRGRLRKRRIIPNNTEDTGLKKRKNLPNQESFFSTPQKVSESVTITQNSVTSLQEKTLPANIISMLASSQSNAAIKAQLASQTAKGPGQILRFVAPVSDGAIKTLRLTGKPNMIISPQNLSNIRFLTSTGIVTLPRNKIISSSSAQTSHPVIQQLLLNQAQLTTSTNTVFSAKSSNSLPSLQKQLLETGVKPPAGGQTAVKVSLVITAPNSLNAMSKPSFVMAPQSSGGVVVTQMSTTSHTGKPVLDLGSLSMTQIQQLIKSQAIQINTGAGNPTTLLLTSGLQQLAMSRPSVLASNVPSTATAQIKIPSNLVPGQTKFIATGASSLLTMINKSQKVASTTPSQILLSNKLNPLLTISGQPSHVIRSQTLGAPQPGTVLRVNTPIATVANSAPQGILPIRSSTAASHIGGKVTAIMNPSVLRPAGQPQKPLPLPRIISSLNPFSSLRVTVAPNSNATTAPTPSTPPQAPVAGQLTEANKAKIISVPVMSPAKKYASNVTVKALLENRGSKRAGEEDSESSQVSTTSVNGEGGEFLAYGSEEIENHELHDTTPGFEERTTGVKTAGAATIIKTLQANKMEPNFSVNGIFPMTCSSATLGSFIPHTHPLSVDTGIHSRSSSTTSSEVIVPTVNIKVPSPNTLPSVLHNKNGTTIVQSTKVPIPVASEAKTGDSLSPMGLTSTIPCQGSAIQSINVMAKVGGLASNGSLITPGSSQGLPSTIKLVSSNPAGPQLTNQVTTMKNVMVKVSPQTGGSGQFVQGFMTSRGLVIPQAALLQQQQGSNVILTNVSQTGGLTQMQSNQIQIQPSQVLGAGNQATTFTISNNGQQAIAITQQMNQQPSQQLLVASPNSSIGLTSQNTSPSMKVMFLNPTISSSQPSFTTSSIMSSSNTPASELVKQLASNTQLQTNAQKQQITISPVSSQQNASHLLSNIVQGVSVQQGSNSTMMPAQNIVNAQSGVGSQLAAQIFTIQQGNQLQQQPNIVLTTKPTQAQGKPPVVALQLQQLGQLLNLGGVTQLQLPQQQLASLQQQLNTRVGQPNQVLQLSINPQTGNQTIMAAPQTSQVVRVASQLSPQNQGIAQMQSQGNLVIQQPQQQTQNIVIQQSNIQQGVMGSGVNLQHANIKQQLTAIPQKFAKTPTLPTTKVQTSMAGHVQNSSNVVLSQLQSPSVSIAPSSVNQFQYVLNPSMVSQPSLSVANVSVMSSQLNKVPAGSLTGNVSRIIRADSSILQNSMNSQNSTLQGLMPSLTQANPSMLVSNSTLSASSLSNKGLSQMIIPNSGAGQFLISPVKLTAQGQQANIISPIKYISALQSPNSLTGQNSTQFVINNSTLPGIQNQMSVKPAVIYAGQANAASDKKEGKVAQILLSQPLANLNSNQTQPVNSRPTSNNTLPVSVAVGVAPVASKLGNDNTTKTILYKIGDQYFSPANNIAVSNIQQVVPTQSPMTTTILSTNHNPGPKTDVQLLVPPACIEASDQILKQNNTLLAANPTLSTGTVVTSSLVQNLGQMRQLGTGGRSQDPQSGYNTTNQLSAGSVNGIHQGNTQFSFSLSGPSTLHNKQPMRSDGNPMFNGQSSGIIGQQQFTGNSLMTQDTAGGTAPPVSNTDMPLRRNVFSGDVSVGQQHRQMSDDNSTLSVQEQNEKEAALNLLTLANQPI
ncbi:unnamed protein product [Lymnaea stagnalis]|uniref:Bromo domain-containing protein n=1 Tax=Lymnaea stagnalis TaxID=6523 RepID=A0AAV2HTC6_LYMST